MRQEQFTPELSAQVVATNPEDLALLHGEVFRSKEENLVHAEAAVRNALARTGISTKEIGNTQQATLTAELDDHGIEERLVSTGEKLQVLRDDAQQNGLPSPR